VQALGLALLLTAALGTGCRKPQPPGVERIAGEPAGADAERNKLQGSWKHTSIDRNGKAVAAPIANEFVMRFQGNKFTTTRSEKPLSEGTFVLDPTKSPPWIDLSENTGAFIYGIYRLEGDKLTICMHEDRRPTEFESRPGQERSLVVLEREKP
jgi:uncharacterized protein (TIGR03067 family)